MQKGLEKNSNYYNRSWNHLQEYLWQVAVVAQNEMHCYNLQTRWAQEPRWLQRSWANAGGWCRWKGRARAQPGLWAGGSAQRCWAPQSSLQSLGRYLTSSNTSDPSVYVSNFSFVFHYSSFPKRGREITDLCPRSCWSPLTGRQCRKIKAATFHPEVAKSSRLPDRKPVWHLPLQWSHNA